MDVTPNKQGGGNSPASKANYVVSFGSSLLLVVHFKTFSQWKQYFATVCRNLQFKPLEQVKNFAWASFLYLRRNLKPL